MVEGKGRFDWQKTSSVESLMININRGKNSKPVSPDELNPFVKKEERKKTSRINGKAAWSMFKCVVENTMQGNK